jgi:hypothetical protein
MRYFLSEAGADLLNIQEEEEEEDDDDDEEDASQPQRGGTSYSPITSSPISAAATAAGSAKAMEELDRREKALQERKEKTLGELWREMQAQAVNQQQQQRGNGASPYLANEEEEEEEEEDEDEAVNSGDDWLQQLRQRMRQQQEDEGRIIPVEYKSESPESSESLDAWRSPKLDSAISGDYENIAGRRRIGVADDVLAEDHVAEERRAMSEEQDMRYVRCSL